MSMCSATASCSSVTCSSKVVNFPEERFKCQSGSGASPNIGLLKRLMAEVVVTTAIRSSEDPYACKLLLVAVQAPPSFFSTTTTRSATANEVLHKQGPTYIA